MSINFQKLLNKKKLYAIILLENKRQKKEDLKVEFLALIFIMSFVILFLLVIAIYQIKMAGMKVTDFWTFIKANDTLDKLYAFAERYEKISPQQQVLFLKEAEAVFDAFDKVPNALWEEEYQKYMKILNKYQSIKVLRWKETSSKKSP